MQRFLEQQPAPEMDQRIWDEEYERRLTKWALAHKDVIDRFGRFPHRNAVLGRTSTAAEAAFLEQPGSSF